MTPASPVVQHQVMDSPSQPKQPRVRITLAPEYRENYANSIQIRVNLWDFFLQFGLIHQQAPDEVELRHFQGVYLSPQQAKALLNLLRHNISQYEGAFGEIKLDPDAAHTGVIQ